MNKMQLKFRECSPVSRSGPASCPFWENLSLSIPIRTLGGRHYNGHLYADEEPFNAQKGQETCLIGGSCRASVHEQLAPP